MPTSRPERPFLTAQWRRLILAQYPVSAQQLTPYIPRGCEPDLWRGSAYVSLVAFEFLDCRVKGVRWLGHANFPELNLRYYVRMGDRRGVSFVREYVPRRMIGWIARARYNEPYDAARMRVSVEEGSIRHQLYKGGRASVIAAKVGALAGVPETGTMEDHFIAQEWGFGRTRRGEATVYRVVHPPWNVYRVESHEIRVDGAGLYGSPWAWLADTEPESVIVAEGSPVSVSPWAHA